MARLVREGLALGYEEAGRGEPGVVFVHGLACHRGFWGPQLSYFASEHRVVAVDLRGHGESDAPDEPNTMRALADDLAWVGEELCLRRPVVVGHSLGGLIALELAAAHPDSVRAVVLIDSVLLAPGDRSGVLRDLVAGLRGPHPAAVLRDYYEGFFGPYDDPARKAWILDAAVRTAPQVTSSVWEQSKGWDDATALKRCRTPALYIDAGTPNADLARARALQPALIVGKTVGSGHFSPLEVPDQVNAMVARFLATALAAR